MRLAVTGLLLAVPLISACGDERQPSSATPAPPEMTAEEILLLAQSATGSAIAYRSTGEFTREMASEGARTFTVTVDWSSPDRSHQVSYYESGIEGSPDFEMDRTETIRIGDRLYIKQTSRDRFSSSDQEWMEWRISSSDARELLDSPRPGLVDPILTGTVTVNRVEAYRITGVPENEERLFPYENTRTEAQDVAFISTSDFRLVRFERTAAVSAIEPAPDQSPAPPEFTMTSFMDFEYLSEPIVIEPPEKYVSLIDDESAPYTPTPVRPLATVTPAPLSTFAPDDPRRHLPLFLEHTPDYDKLELGNNVVVSYPSCNPNSILDRWAHTVIYYTLDGSRAANWTIHDSLAIQDGAAISYSDFFEFDNIVYHSEEGRAALDAVLSDPELMHRIREHAAKPARCPAEFVDIDG